MITTYCENQIVGDKTLIKLMEVNFRLDYILSKTKSLLYSEMKTDIKALIEYEFEF